VPTRTDRRLESKNWLLGQLSAAEYDQLAPYLEHVRLMHKQVLLRARDHMTHVYFPTRGAVSLIARMRDDTAVETATTGRDGCVGVSALFGDTMSLQDWLVQVPGEAQRMRADVFQRVAQAGGLLRDLVGRYTLVLLDQTTRGSACNRLHLVQQRLARWVLVVHDLADGDELPLTQEFLALMLGVRRASVNQAAGALQRAELLYYERGLVTVLDRQGLERASCEDYERTRDTYQRLLGRSARRADVMSTPPEEA
jgi:CRP-like cAMP-binding protein